MKLSALILLATLAGAGAAAAQTPDDGAPPANGAAPPPGYGPGQGRFQPSPQMRAARQAMRQACAADMQTLCAGQTGRDAMMCMRQNAASVSQPCKDAMAKMRALRPRGPRGGGFGGPPGGDPGAPPPAN